MKFQLFNILCPLTLALVILTGLACTPAYSVCVIRIENPLAILPLQQPQDEKSKTEKDNDGEAATEEDSKALSQDKPTVPNNHVRFHMWDGTIVAGEVEFNSISIKTEFGVLEVPIEKVKKLMPGLDSFPERLAKLDKLVEELGNKDFDIREKAQRELSEMGPQIGNELANFKDGGNSERKKRLAKLREEINEMLDDSDEADALVMIRGDSVVTPEFAIVGKILQKTFTVNSKFGQLTIQLNDIKMAERSMAENRETVNKTINVGAEKFFQRQPVSTRIRVNKGDRISIKADGVVQWTSWNTSSTPDGQANQGVYQGIKSGTLCARIGTSGKIIKVGSGHNWTASKSGVLYLAISMQENYLNNNNSYRWAGQYRAKVNVKPSTN